MENRIESEAKFWNSIASKYDNGIEKQFKKAYDFIFQHLMEDTSDSDELLEIATGTGTIAIKLSGHVPNITAIDIARDMLDVAEEKSSKKQIDNITFKYGDACALEFEDQSFDTIIAANVTHLLNKPQIALQEMNRVLKNNGKIIVPTFCHGANLRTHFLSRMASLWGQKTNSRWSREGFRKFIEQNGFQVTKDAYIDEGLFPLVYLVAKKNNG